MVHGCQSVTDLDGMGGVVSMRREKTRRTHGAEHAPRSHRGKHGQCACVTLARVCVYMHVIVYEIPLWLPQVLNQGLSHQCTCFSYMREAGALTQVYQTCTSPYPFDTLVTGMPLDGTTQCGSTLHCIQLKERFEGTCSWVSHNPFPFLTKEHLRLYLTA